MGRSPRIERVLQKALPEDRAQLLEDLLRIELEHRRSAGERPTPEDYFATFPDRLQSIRAVFDDLDEQHPEFGRSVGRLELLEEIGRGREGIVYRAREPGIAAREVAVKLLSTGLFRSRDDEERFATEVQTLARLHHEHIVPYFGSGDDRGQWYYSMRLMSGMTLADVPKPMEPCRAVGLLIKLTQAVCYLHSQPRPVIHRDLKPQNILFDETGRPHVADFGLSFLFHEDRAVIGACGTVPYIAPEQLDRRFGDVGPACDIYSLGVILYELLTGQTPFPRSAESIVLTLERDPTPPSRLRPGISNDLESICLKCLARSTRKRYSSANELLVDLRCVDRGEPLSSPPEGLLSRLVHKARREPALAVRLAVIVACSTIIWSYRLAVGRFAAILPEHWAHGLRKLGLFPTFISLESILVWLNQAILLAWGFASWAFQRRLNRTGDQDGLQFGWRLVDVLVLALLIELDDALMSPLTVAFAVLIVASAFWARAGQIIQTTALSMAAYFLLVLSYRHFHPVDRPWRHLHYLVGLAAIGLMLVYQANRTRALARICGERG
ncbi:MAG: serine/threonine-protein kinase [Isosphaeraceae bacterium]